jgi:subfamily B ATP-binding cassette protein MsbA
MRLKIAGWEHIAGLFKWQKRLIFKFFFSAVLRAICTMLLLLLIQQFLSGSMEPGAKRGVIMRPVYELLSPLGQSGMLIAMGVLLLATQVFGSLANYWNVLIQNRISKVVELGMMEKLIRHLLTLSVPFFDKQSHGDIVTAVRNDVTQLRVMIKSMATICLEALMAGALLLTAIKLNAVLAAYSLVVLPLASFPIFLIARATLKSSFKIRLTGYVLSDIILQILRGIRVIKAFRAEETQARSSLEKGRVFFDNQLEQTKVKSLAGVVMDTLSGLLIVTIIVFGGHRVAKGEQDWSSLLTFVMAIRAMYGPINNMNNNYLEMQTAGASVQRINEFLKHKPDIEDKKDAKRMPEPPTSISFEHVRFSYGDKTVMDDVSFKVNAGETIGIVGPSGGGKSTMLSLLVRFYDPTSGVVRFGADDLRDVKVADVYSKIAIVTQEPFLFATSARENIRCGRPEATDEEVEEAAKAAYIHNEILSLPQGYDTPIGMGGRELSGGQRQRVSVARALLKNAPILLLDEATSALDSVAEAEVQKAIDKLMVGRTSFVVAHRLSTLRNADRLLVMDTGSLVGFAPHEELLKTCATYKKMWDAQRFHQTNVAAMDAAAAAS